MKISGWSVWSMFSGFVVAGVLMEWISPSPGRIPAWSYLAGAAVLTALTSAVLLIFRWFRRGGDTAKGA